MFTTRMWSSNSIRLKTRPLTCNLKTSRSADHDDGDDDAAVDDDADVDDDDDGYYDYGDIDDGLRRRR